MRSTSRVSFDSKAPPGDVPLPAFGELIGSKYRMAGTIGHGGSGVVLHGRDEQLERDVAIKLIRPELCTIPEIKEAFLAEARAIARLTHPNVVRIFDYGEHKGLPYFVMEHFESVDLDIWIAARKGEPIPLDEALGILDQIARGVEAIHEGGTAHLDLKPGNVLMGRSFRIAVADFGLARMVTTSPEQVSGLGTPGFIAPEFILGTHSPDLWTRADTYALGVMAYELLCGETPFVGSTAKEIVHHQMNHTPPLPSEFRQGLSPVFDGIVMDCLRFDAKDRPTVAEFRSELHRIRSVSPDASAGLRIVIADSDPASRRLLEHVLTAELPFVSVEMVPDGTGALHGIASAHTALLITELPLPGLSGAKLIRAMRRDPGFDHVAVLVFSGDVSSGEWADLRAAGADAILLKPLETKPLVAMVRDLLDTGRRDWSVSG